MKILDTKFHNDEILKGIYRKELEQYVGDFFDFDAAVPTKQSATSQPDHGSYAIKYIANDANSVPTSPLDDHSTLLQLDGKFHIH